MGSVGDKVFLGAIKCQWSVKPSDWRGSLPSRKWLVTAEIYLPTQCIPNASSLTQRFPSLGTRDHLQFSSRSASGDTSDRESRAGLSRWDPNGPCAGLVLSACRVRRVIRDLCGVQMRRIELSVQLASKVHGLGSPAVELHGWVPDRQRQFGA
ncbi:hypothetical protein BO78DRAFT_143695 [Aspergillus sclerotiicarbonarius CBS 121057]|uniref:Uncharacterized protein n=1 Tax=Aspergillus sclerotiicarbonarius (strain CBS 121057 / IBT 28362) TaxID=1448318 RepID=A0A319E6F4_ASPSB|nr:hypothetical protein BO78DRAFT_143695 [Aspergillus sclerotiicarbonarius CBS 121057]